MFIVTLVTKAHPNAHESGQIKWNIHTVEHYTGVKTNELQ